MPEHPTCETCERFTPRFPTASVGTCSQGVSVDAEYTDGYYVDERFGCNLHSDLHSDLEDND